VAPATSIAGTLAIIEVIPPTFDARAMDMRNGTGLISKASQARKVKVPIIKIVVI
jgi:hypothetical protein